MGGGISAQNELAEQYCLTEEEQREYKKMYMELKGRGLSENHIYRVLEQKAAMEKLSSPPASTEKPAEMASTAPSSSVKPLNRKNSTVSAKDDERRQSLNRKGSVAGTKGSLPSTLLSSSRTLTRVNSSASDLGSMSPSRENSIKNVPGRSRANSAGPINSDSPMGPSMVQRFSDSRLGLTLEPVHENVYRCDQCEKNFDSAVSLEWHLTFSVEHAGARASAAQAAGADGDTEMKTKMAIMVFSPKQTENKARAGWQRAFNKVVAQKNQSMQEKTQAKIDENVEKLMTIRNDIVATEKFQGKGTVFGIHTAEEYAAKSLNEIMSRGQEAAHAASGLVEDSAELGSKSPLFLHMTPRSLGAAPSHAVAADRGDSGPTPLFSAAKFFWQDHAHVQLYIFQHLNAPLGGGPVKANIIEIVGYHIGRKEELARIYVREEAVQTLMVETMELAAARKKVTPDIVGSGTRPQQSQEPAKLNSRRNSERRDSNVSTSGRSSYAGSHRNSRARDSGVRGVLENVAEDKTITDAGFSAGTSTSMDLMDAAVKRIATVDQQLYFSVEDYLFAHIILQVDREALDLEEAEKAKGRLTSAERDAGATQAKGTATGEARAPCGCPFSLAIQTGRSIVGAENQLLQLESFEDTLRTYIKPAAVDYSEYAKQ